MSSLSLPSLVLFDDGVPQIYEGDLTDSLKVKQWVVDEVKSGDVETVNTEVLKRLAKRTEAMAVIFQVRER